MERRNVRRHGHPGGSPSRDRLLHRAGSAEGIGELEGVPISGILGDQHAALFGQTCFDPGSAKNTYGTGCFMLLNTGEEVGGFQERAVDDRRLPDRRRAPVYALEGSIAVTGSLIQWLRDNLGLISESAEVEALARTGRRTTATSISSLPLAGSSLRIGDPTLGESSSA